MAPRLSRAGIWLLERPRPDKRRPVLVLSRPSLIAVLNTVTVAAITSTRRGSPTGDVRMSAAVALDALDLAALLCSRVCHDLISPTGAIVNGLEVLEEKDSDEETKSFALDLIKRSAKTASVRLQFCRLAFGAAGSANAQIDLGNAQVMARAFIEDEKTKLLWNLPYALLPKNRVKLLLNLVMLAINAVPRGGAVQVTVTGDADSCEFVLRSKGLNARIPPHAEARTV